jgi:hemoglobin/transferrin/lactoferrin receptor protein
LFYLGYDEFNSDSEVFVEDEIRFSPPFRDFSIDAPRRDRQKIRFDYEYTASGELLSTIKLDAYHQTSDREFNTFPQMTLAPGLNTDTSIFTTSQLVSDGFNLQADLLSGQRYAIVTGVQWLRDEVEQDRLRFVITNGVETSRETQFDDARLETSAVYLQADIDATDNLTIYAGLRSYRVDGELSASDHGPAGTDFDDSHSVGSLAAVYTMDQHSLRANYSEGYIYPSLFNLVIGAYAGSSYINPVIDLEPETSGTTELGYRFSGEQLSIDATLFHTRAKNYIDHLPCTTADNCPGRRDRIYRNVGKANSHGLELSLSYRASSVTWSTGLTWLQREKQYEGVNTWDAGVPQLSGYIAAEHEGSLAQRPLISRLVARFESETDELVATRRGSRLDHNPGYGVVDLEFFYQPRPSLHLGLIAGNLGDKKYHSATENLWAPGRHARVRLSLEI